MIKKYLIQNNKREKASSGGFSLLELVVYLAISSFLVTTMFSGFFVQLRGSIELEQLVMQKHEEFIK